MADHEARPGAANAVDVFLLDEIDNAAVAAKKLDAAAFMVDAIAENPTEADPNAIEGLALMISECARTLELLACAAHKKIYEA